MSKETTYRIVTRGKNGELRARDYEHQEAILRMHTQIGVDDCSTDLSLRGLPVFRGSGRAKVGLSEDEAVRLAGAMPPPAFDADRRLRELDEIERQE